MVLLVVLVAACGPRQVSVGSTPGGPSLPGAAAPQVAVDAYLAGVRAQDIQAMGAMWGTENGPAREQMDQQEYEMRLLTMVCLLGHSEARRVRGPESKGDTVLFNYELRTADNRRAETTIKLLRGPQARWYILTFDPVPNLCRRPPARAPRNHR